MNPDADAATVADHRTWKGAALPVVGQRITARHWQNMAHGRRATHTFTGTVAHVALSYDGRFLELRINAQDTAFTLDAESTWDVWDALTGSPSDFTRIPLPDPWDNLEMPDSTDPDKPTTVTVTGDEVPDPRGNSVSAKIRRLVYLKRRVKEIDEEAKGLNDEIRVLDDEIRSEWADENTSSVTLDGNTVYVYPTFHVEHVGGATPADIREALKDSGLDHMIAPNYSASALKAYLKELRGLGSEPPERLAAVTKLVIGSEIRVRAAAGRTVPIVY